MDAHLAALCRSGCYQLRQLRPVTGFLSTAAAETVVHTFVVNRLDYCNPLLYGVADELMRRLQARCRATCNQCATLCSHYTDLATTPLIARATASTV